MFPSFEPLDFDLFVIPGFEERMNVLRSQLSPKFAQMGALLKDDLSMMVGDELFPHVAKHMRRRTNPPNDSWVAFGGKRGYKMGPHFQICVWQSHVLIQWGLIYEAQNKTVFAGRLREELSKIRSVIPVDYQWSKDHMRPEGMRQSDMSDADFLDMSERLETRKNGEVMVGKVIPREEATQLSGPELQATILSAWQPLVVLHRMAGSRLPNFRYS